MKKLRVGVFGAGRGCDLAQNFLLLDCDIVALCDSREDRIKEGLRLIPEPEAVYHDFDSFIAHDMDAVILANDFDQHTPYAIRCLKKGIHVFSECIVSGTMAESVALVRAAEKSDAVFMLAENYPQMKFNLEMKRIADGKTLGKILYGEGEYNHPTAPDDSWFRHTYNYYPEHWRNFLPRTYYVTHSLAPLMRATGATPKRVTAMNVYAPFPANVPSASYVGDRAAVIVTLNDDDSVFKFTGCAAFGAEGNSYRLCGTEGQIENLRGMDGQVMLRYNKWSVPEGMKENNLYMPGWNDPDEELIEKSGHGGADYLTARMFLSCVRDGKQPEHPFDVYSATVMSSVAILGHRSALENGTPYDIPDFREEAWRVKYENDRLTPFFGPDGEAPTIACCSHPDYRPTEEQFRLYKEDLGL